LTILSLNDSSVLFDSAVDEKDENIGVFSVSRCIPYDNSTRTDCTFVNISTCSVKCHYANLATTDHQPQSKFQKTFWIYFTVNFVATSLFGPIISFVDSFAYMCLGERRSLFGQQRLWGTVGFGTFSVKSGLLMDLFQVSPTEKNYTYPFIMFLLLIVSCGIIVMFCRLVVENISGSFLGNVWKIIRNVELDLILLTAFVAGYLAGTVEGFLFWFLSSLGGPQLLFGLCQAVQCIAETVLLYFSGHLITLFGPMICLEIVFVAFGVRLFLYAFLKNPWCTLSIEPLHCLCFALFYTSLTMRASVLAPPGMQTTVQSLIGAVYMSLGRAVGVAVGGVLYELYGPQVMFLVFSGTSFVYAVCILIYHLSARKSHPAVEVVDHVGTAAVASDATDKEDKEMVTVGGDANKLNQPVDDSSRQFAEISSLLKET
jgi:hypothetical protein